ARHLAYSSATRSNCSLAAGCIESLLTYRILAVRTPCAILCPAGTCGRSAVIGRGAEHLALEQHEKSLPQICGIDRGRWCYFCSGSVVVAGPSPMISSTASSSLAPSQCTCLA